MARQYSAKTFIRRVPNLLLRQYFERRGICLAIDWDLGDVLNPTPGEITFRVEVDYAEGMRECGEFESEIGVRTDDVILVAWIDPNNVPLNPAGVSPQLLTLFPVAGSPVVITPPCGACEVIGAVANGISNVCGITLNDYDNPQPQGDANRKYLLHWMFKYAGNPDPAMGIPGGDFRNDADTHMDENDLLLYVTIAVTNRSIKRLTFGGLWGILHE